MTRQYEGSRKANCQVRTDLPDLRKENARPEAVKHEVAAILALRTNHCHSTSKSHKTLGPVALQVEIRMEL